MTADAARHVVPDAGTDAGTEAGPGGGVEVRTEGEVASVRFWGTVDLAVRQAATAEVLRVPDAATVLRVDCRDVTFMDSTGMSVLVRVLRDAAAEARTVHFLGAAPQVTELLRAAGVDRWMESLGVRPGR